MSFTPYGMSVCPLSHAGYRVQGIKEVEPGFYALVKNAENRGD
jgi:hypothetical protein